MTKIFFDEPSNGVVDISNTVALDVKARGEQSHCIKGETDHDKGGAGVIGTSKAHVGVHGICTGKGHGVFGEATDPDEGGAGVIGKSTKWVGVLGQGPIAGRFEGDVEGVHGICTGKGHGVFGEATDPNEGGAGVIGKSTKWVGVLGQGPIAGRFEGDVEVTGDIRLLGGSADCAEEFDVHDKTEIEPGTVMVLGNDGKLVQCSMAYDKKVIGVVSGGGGYKPGIVLDKKIGDEKRASLALLGKVYCKVDTKYSEIEVGDLLTTSPSKGYAMKAADPKKSFGTIIGKALSSLRKGHGLVPILVALQ